MAKTLCKWFIGLSVALTAFYLATRKEAKKPTCQRAGMAICHCQETGVCLCDGFRSCASCRHLLSPTEQEAKHQAALKELAERLKQTTNPKQVK